MPAVFRSLSAGSGVRMRIAGGMHTADPGGLERTCAGLPEGIGGGLHQAVTHLPFRSQSCVGRHPRVFLADGTEKEVRPDSTTTANIALEGVPLRWTGKLIPKDKAMRMFMFKRSYQVQHINGLTFDFLYDMAKKLAEADALMLVGGGAKGNEPLVMSNGGTPYRAFLEGRVNGESYALILRLTNLELKEIPTK